MDENSKFRGKIDDHKDVAIASPVENGGKGFLKERNRYEYVDDEITATPLFLSDAIAIKQPFPPSVVARRKGWHELDNYEPWRTAPNNLSKSAELSSKICHDHEQLQLELEAAFFKVMTLEGYEVSEEMMGELNRTFEEQKDRQERFKHHLRSSWQRPCASGIFACCDSRPSFTSK